MKKLLIQYCLLSIGMLSAQASLLDVVKVGMDSKLAEKTLITEKKVISPATFVWTYDKNENFLGSLGEPVHGLPGTLPQVAFLDDTLTFPIRQMVAVINTPALSTVEIIKSELKKAFQDYQDEEKKDVEEIRQRAGSMLSPSELSKYMNFDYFLKNGKIITQYIIHGKFKTFPLSKPFNVQYNNQHVLYYPYIFSQLKTKDKKKEIVAGVFNADGLDAQYTSGMFVKRLNPSYLLLDNFSNKKILFDKFPKTTNQDTKIFQVKNRSVAYFWTVVFDVPFFASRDENPNAPKVMMVTCHLLTDMDVDGLDKLSAQQTLKDFLAYMKKPGQNDDEKAVNTFVANIEKTFDNYAVMKKQEEEKKKQEEEKKKQEEIKAEEVKKKKQEEERKKIEKEEKQQTERLEKERKEAEAKKKKEQEQSLKEAQAKYNDLFIALEQYKEFLDKIPKSA